MLDFFRRGFQSNSGGLIILSLFALSRWLMNDQITESSDRLDIIIPSHWWGTIWFIASIAGIVAAFMRSGRKIMMSILLGLIFMWGIAYIGAWIVGSSPNGNVYGSIFLAIVFGFIWGLSRQPFRNSFSG